MKRSIKCLLCVCKLLLGLLKQVLLWDTVELGSQNEIVFSQSILSMGPDPDLHVVPALRSKNLSIAHKVLKQAMKCCRRHLSGYSL